MTVGVLLALLVGEVLVRAQGRGVPLQAEEGQVLLAELTERARDVPGLPYRLRPGASHKRVYSGLPGEPGTPVEYRVNAAGFRGPEVELEKPEGVVRVAVLGDSFTFGTGLGDEDTWPRQLERLCNELLDAPRVEVLNFGVEGYNTTHELLVLEGMALAYEPDLVLVCGYVNDPFIGSPSERPTADDLPPAVAWIERLGLSSGVVAEGQEATEAERRTMWLRRRSRLFDLFAYELYREMSFEVTVATYQHYWRAESRGWQQMESALGLLAEQTRAEGLPLLMIMYPFLARLGEDYPFRLEHERLAATCEELGIEYHELMPALARMDPDRLQVHPHDMHPSREANAVVARELFVLLEERLVALAQ